MAEAPPGPWVRWGSRVGLGEKAGSSSCSGATGGFQRNVSTAMRFLP